MKVTIYGADWCGYCTKAKELCLEKGIAYDDVNIDKEPEAKTFVKESLGASTIPQILVDGEHVGGYDDFVAKLESSED